MPMSVTRPVREDDKRQEEDDQPGDGSEGQHQATG
jgi:hypothetical protein